MNEEICCITNKGKIVKNEWENVDSDFLRALKCVTCGKKWPKMTKNSACFTPYFRNRTSYDYGFWYSSVK